MLFSLFAYKKKQYLQTFAYQSPKNSGSVRFSKIHLCNFKDTKPAEQTCFVHGFNTNIVNNVYNTSFLEGG